MSAFPLTKSPLIVPACAYWIDAADQSTITESGGSISSIVSKGTSKITLTQSTQESRPTYVQNGLNGKPVIRGDGADFMAMPNPNILIRCSGFSMFSVVMTNNASLQQVASVVSTNGSSATTRAGIFVTAFAELTVAARLTDGASAVSITGGSFTAGEYFIMEGLFDYSTGNGYLYKNGNLVGSSASIGTGAMPSTTPAGVGFLAQAGGGLRWNGDIAESIIYNSYLDTSNRKIIENYLANKWGISL